MYLLNKNNQTRLKEVTGPALDETGAPAPVQAPRPPSIPSIDRARSENWIQRGKKNKVPYSLSPCGMQPECRGTQDTLVDLSPSDQVTGLVFGYGSSIS